MNFLYIRVYLHVRVMEISKESEGRKFQMRELESKHLKKDQIATIDTIAILHFVNELQQKFSIAS